MLTVSILVLVLIRVLIIGVICRDNVDEEASPATLLLVVGFFPMSSLVLGLFFYFLGGYCIHSSLLSNLRDRVNTSKKSVH